MHQPAVRSPRPLAARGCRWSGRQRRPLPFLRGFPPQRAAAARSALAHAAAFARRAPAAPPALKRAPHLSSLETRPMLRARRPSDPYRVFGFLFRRCCHPRRPSPLAAAPEPRPARSTRNTTRGPARLFLYLQTSDSEKIAERALLVVARAGKRDWSATDRTLSSRRGLFRGSLRR